MNLTCQGLKDAQAWQKANVILPTYDVEALAARTKENPM